MFGAAWLKGEQRLQQDENSTALLQKYYHILDLELDVDAKLDPTVRHQQLVKLLDRKLQALQAKKLTVLLGCTPGFEKRLSDIFQNLLSAKDLITTAARASPPASIACAGVAVILTVCFLLPISYYRCCILKSRSLTFVQLFIQAANQQKSLLDGLEYSSALIRRLAFIDAYQSDPAISLDSMATESFMADFDTYLASLCSKVLEFQARALCYLLKRRVSRALRDTFKRDGWDELLGNLKDGDIMVERYVARIEAANQTLSLKRIESEQRAAKDWHDLSEREKRVKRFLEKLYEGTCHYRDSKDRNDERVPGTCEWFINHDRFQEWAESQESALLWVSADPGCGKSVLVRHLIDDVLSSTSKTTLCYFFFKDDFVDQKSATNALCAILRQIFFAKPFLLSDSLLTKAEADGSKFMSSMSDLWHIIVNITADRDAGQFIIVLDALDECQGSDRSRLIRSIKNLFSSSHLGHLKFLMTSRPYHHIKSEFQELEESIATIHLGHLSAENQDEVDKISREIDLVIDYRVEKISKDRNLQPAEQKFLQDQIKGTPKSQRTYLWVTLVLDVIKNKPGFSRGKVWQSLGEVPQKLDDAYEKILARSPDQKGARKILSILIAATQPLTVQQISLMSAIDQKHEFGGDIDDYTEDNFQDTIRAICGLFVVIIDTRVYLLHQTGENSWCPTNSIETLVPCLSTTR
jgi:hypothetical protein